MHTREYLRLDQMEEVLKLGRRQIYRILERCKIRGNTFFIVPEEIRKMKPGDKLLKVSEVAKILNCSRSTVNRWFWEGKLTGVKLGKELRCSIRIFESSVSDFIKSGEQ